ncbi:unnamed protein product [Prunus armeniaca]
MEKAMERLKIWQSTELELDEYREAIDQLMKDLDLLHRQNMAPKPILEMSLCLSRDVLNPPSRPLSSARPLMKPPWLIF